MKLTFLILTLIILLSGLFIACNSPKAINHANRCSSFPKNDFLEAKIVSLKSIVDNDTIQYNELRFYCLYSSLYTKKGMFDAFGKWDVMMNEQLGRSSDFVWKDVKLFNNDTLTFQVAAGGVESRNEMYSSVVVFDQNGKDMLQEGSPYIDKLEHYFGQLIKNNDDKKTDFYKNFKSHSPIIRIYN